MDPAQNLTTGTTARGRNEGIAQSRDPTTQHFEVRYSKARTPAMDLGGPPGLLPTSSSQGIVSTPVLTKKPAACLGLGLGGRNDAQERADARRGRSRIR
jgi:hypothetical protein